MRKGILVVGVVLLILGAVLWYLPISTTQSQAVPNGDAWTIGANPPLALLTPTIPYTVTWNSASGLNVSVYDCGSSGSCTSSSLVNPVATGNGGSLSWSGTKGDSYAIVPSRATTLNLGIGEPIAGGLLGLLLVVVGIILALVGAASGGSKMRPAPVPVPPPMPPQGTSESAADGNPPASSP